MHPSYTRSTPCLVLIFYSVSFHPCLPRSRIPRSALTIEYLFLHSSPAPHEGRDRGGSPQEAVKSGESSGRASQPLPTIAVMLRVIDPDESPPELAYPVPWAITRTRAPECRARNAGPEILERVTVADLTTGRLLTTAAVRVAPGQTIEIPLDRSRAGAAILRWTRPTGSEYLFRITS